MALLQKVVLGTPPTAVDGDTVRDANTKMNSNVDVLGKQATLTSTAALIIAPQALTAAHVGTRVSINLAAAGTINLPAASTCGADQVIHLRNLGATLVTLAITAGSGDTIALTTLAAGESAALDTDGVHAWNCLLRGRASSANETVQGNSAVVGNESVGGTLGVSGAAAFGGTVTLAADPSAALQAATKQYVDAAAAARVLRAPAIVNAIPAILIGGITSTFAVAGQVAFTGPAAGSTGAGLFTGFITCSNAAVTTAAADAFAYMDILDTVTGTVVANSATALRTIPTGSVFNDVNLPVSCAVSGLVPGRVYEARIQIKYNASVGVASTVAALGISGLVL